MATTRDRVLPNMQRARQIIERIGFRRYRTVTIRVRTYPSGERGEGRAEVENLVLSPAPKVRVVRTAQEVTSGGEIEIGDYVISKITPRFYDAAKELWGGYYPTAQLPRPSKPTVTPQGIAGLAAYGYRVIALKGTETCSEASARGTTSTGSSTLDGTNFNRLSGYEVEGATSYLIYRDRSTGTPSSTGLLGETNEITFDDTGLAGNGAVVAPPRLQASIDEGQETVIAMTGDDGAEIELVLKSINIDRALGYTIVAGRRVFANGA